MDYEEKEFPVDVEPYKERLMKYSSRLTEKAPEFSKLQDQIFQASPSRETGFASIFAQSNTDLKGYEVSYALLSHVLGDLQGKRALEIGCHLGLLTDFLVHEEGVIGIGIDTDEEAIVFGRNGAGIDLRIGDATVLHTFEYPFDVVMAPHFLDFTYLNQVYSNLLSQNSDYRIHGYSQSDEAAIKIINNASKALLDDGVLIATNGNILNHYFKELRFRKCVNFKQYEFDGSGDGLNNYFFSK
jgi:hypothetical protein